MRRTLAAAALALVVPLAAVAQSPVPKRPRLDPRVGTDTNDARLYHQQGLRLLEKSPGEAVDAFIWAARLDPSWADPVYGQRIAQLLKNETLVEAILSDNDTKLRSEEMRRLDSLHFRALSLNPFLHRNLDALMLRAYLFRVNKDQLDRFRMQRNAEGQDDFSLEDADLDRAIDDMFRNSGGRFRAWYAYSTGRFPEAIKYYESEVKRARPEFRAEIRADLARAHFGRGDRAKALSELSLAIAELRSRDASSLVRVYESKALYEHAAGLLHEIGGATDSARAAYGRALQEDLAYWPAHRQLGMLLLSAGDTAGAVAELSQAVQLAGDDAGLRYSYGYVLTAANKLDEAVAEFRKAIELAPDYAAPYSFVGRIYDAAGFASQATDYYEAFVVRAPKRDPQVVRTMQRLTALASQPDSTKAKAP